MCVCCLWLVSLFYARISLHLVRSLQLTATCLNLTRIYKLNNDATSSNQNHSDPTCVQVFLFSLLSVTLYLSNINRLHQEFEYHFIFINDIAKITKTILLQLKYSVFNYNSYCHYVKLVLSIQSISKLIIIIQFQSKSICYQNKSQYYYFIYIATLWNSLMLNSMHNKI